MTNSKVRLICAYSWTGFVAQIIDIRYICTGDSRVDQKESKQSQVLKNTCVYKSRFGHETFYWPENSSKNYFKALQKGCQMVCFQTKHPNLGKFWRVLQWIVRGNFIYFSRFGILYQEKSGNPALYVW
jgi:hypothetical protein